jgi:hypothetical protein
MVDVVKLALATMKKKLNFQLTWSLFSCKQSSNSELVAVLKSHSNPADIAGIDNFVEHGTKCWGNLQ